MPADLAARYALPGPPVLRGSPTNEAPGVVAGDLACGEESIHFHLHRAAGEQRPLVLIVPILAGGRELMSALANRLVERGFHAAWCDRAGPAMSPPQRAADLEQLFRRTIVHQRALLAYLRLHAGLSPNATFALGISMGGMVSAVLAAVEPDLDGTAICLAGADLPAIVLDSSESRVENWRNWRHEVDGLGNASLLQELRRYLQTDPARLAAFVPTDRVLVISTALDTVVRPEHQQLLWEALGRPRRLTLPLGHYTAALALDPMMTSVADFFHERDAAQEKARLAARPAIVPASAAVAEQGP